MIPIESNKPDWNAIRAEYIGGGISQRKLAAKHRVKYATLRDRSISEGWVAMRDAAQSKAIAQAEQKTASAAADNAVKLEQARGLAIEYVRANLEQMQKYQGSKVSVRQTDSKGHPINVDFDMLDLVTALEKLQKIGGYNGDAAPVQVIIDV